MLPHTPDYRGQVERGAAMVEFTIGAVLILLILFATIDLSWILFRLGLASYQLNREARLQAIVMALPQTGTLTCDVIASQIASNIQSNIDSSIARVSNLTVGAAISDAGPEPYFSLRVTANVPLACITCSMLPRSTSFQISGDAMIENPSFRCS